MTRPYHGQVLAAMRRLRGSGTAPGPLAVYAEIKRDPDLPRSVSHDGVLLAGLMEAAARPGHAPAYAAIVAGNGIRRRIAVAASRMIQAAEGQDLETALHGRPGKAGTWPLPGTVGRIARADAAGTARD